MIKIILFGTLITLVIACGKAPKNSSDKSDNEYDITPGLATDLVLELDIADNSAQTMSYKIKDYGWANIPKYIYLKTGSPQHFTTRVYFNSLDQNSILSTGGELYCDYINTKKIGSEGYLHHFDGCYDGEIGERTNHDPFNEESSNAIAIDKDKLIKFELLDGFASSGTYSLFTEIFIQAN